MTTPTGRRESEPVIQELHPRPAARSVQAMVSADFSALELRCAALRALDVQPEEVPEAWVSQPMARSYTTARLASDLVLGSTTVAAGTLVAVRWEHSTLDDLQRRGGELHHYFMVFVFGAKERAVVRDNALYDFR